MGEVLDAQEAPRRGLRRVRRARRRLRQARRRAGDASRRSSPPSGADSDVQMEIAADALRLAAVGREDRHPLRRREAPRGAVPAAAVAGPTCCCSTSRPTTSTPRASIGSSSSSPSFPGTVIAVTHDRYFLDNAAEWILELDRGYGIPWKGNYSSWLEQKEQRLEIESKQEAGAHQGDEAGARVGAQEPEGPAGEEQGAHHALRGARLATSTRSATRPRRSSSRSPSAWATR